ncbi:uncharacterized protein LOC143554386 [Bidens hawaiensis]|uniref:uncharacterized protein LOC143554386 n=1 Tax=Bidens hawaiensis TaxID=980011 RepID=UPI00404A5C35
MEKHIQIFLNKISILSITIATLILLISIFQFQFPQTCNTPNPNPNHPKSSCAAAHRPTTTIYRKNHRLWSTATWRKSVNSFTTIFHHLQTLDIISNHTHAVIVSAGGGQAVMAMKDIGVSEVVGVEVVGSPPLVDRADPHKLPYFEEVFGLGFSAGLDQAVFPGRYVREMERVVRVGGVVVVCVEACGGDGVGEVTKMFRRSEILLKRNVTVMGSKMTMIGLKRV